MAINTSARERFTKRNIDLDEDVGYCYLGRGGEGGRVWTTTYLEIQEQVGAAYSEDEKNQQRRN
jgi:hypothetical protein